MKTRLFLLAGLMICTLLLGACSSTKANTNAAASANGTPAAANPNDNQELSVATKLALGTLKLEGTDQAVTADQANTLLTLWQAYQALTNSDTTAQVELDAVVEQIQASMTSEQTKAIDDLQLTRQSMGEIMQSAGIEFGPGSRAQRTPAAGQSSSGNNRQGNGEGGRQFFGGGPGDGGMPPDGGGVMGGGPQGANGAQITPNATLQARFRAQASRVNPMILQGLIKMLETKAGLTPEPTK